MLWIAKDKSIALHSFWATTHRYMIINITYSILSTCSRTRIYTFIFHTCIMSWTIGVQYTFWSTANVWISLVFIETRAYAIITLSIWTTRRWITWVRINWRGYNCIIEKTDCNNSTDIFKK